jgi:hypothetical protein
MVISDFEDDMLAMEGLRRDGAWKRAEWETNAY